MEGKQPFNGACMHIDFEINAQFIHFIQPQLHVSVWITINNHNNCFKEIIAHLNSEYIFSNPRVAFISQKYFTATNTSTEFPSIIGNLRI